MSKTLAIVFFVAMLVLQLFVGQLGGGVSINLVLATLVVLCAFLSVETMLILALSAGLVLDSHSGNAFGLHMSYYIFAVLVAKLVLRLGEKNQSFGLVFTTTFLLLVLYSFISFVNIFSVDELTQLRDYSGLFLRELVANVVVLAGVYWAASAMASPVFVSFLAKNRFGKYLR